MKRAMPSRAAVLFALVLLLVASVSVWVQSYWRFDAVSAFRRTGFAVMMREKS